jgi:hypothetical protein
LAELQQRRKQLWLQCLRLAANLSELRAQGEDVRARAAGHVQLLAARQLLGDAAGDGGGVGEEGGGAGAARAGTVEEVRRMMTEAHDALKEWEKAASDARRSLQRRTDEAAAGLTPEVSA